MCKGWEMPSIEWDAFQHDHHRPHLLIVSLEAVTNASAAKKDFERLADKLGASGRYSVKTEGANIYVAFEDDVDAAKFSTLLRLERTTREVEWASKTLAHMDGAAYRKIKAILSSRRRSAAKRR